MALCERAKKGVERQSMEGQAKTTACLYLLYILDSHLNLLFPGPGSNSDLVEERIIFDPLLIPLSPITTTNSIQYSTCSKSITLKDREG